MTHAVWLVALAEVIASQFADVASGDLVAVFYRAIFWVVVVTFVIVEGLLLVSAVRFWRRAGGQSSASLRASGRPELVWTVIPAVITVVMLFFVWQALMVG